MNGDGLQGVAYQEVDEAYFTARALRPYAGVLSLWAIGVGAVISGHFSGWNLGLGFGWGSMFAATLVVTVMFAALAFSIAEMAAALPHAGGAYSYARSAMGPWGGFVAGVAQNIEYTFTAAVVVFFIGIYAVLSGMPGEYQPLVWIGCYGVFVGVNLFGAEASFRIAALITLTSLGCLVVFLIVAAPNMDFERWALDIGVSPEGALMGLPGGGPWFPAGVQGMLAALPFALWFFLGVEQIPLAAEEAFDPQKDMPRAILAAVATLAASAIAVVTIAPSLPPGSFGLKGSGAPVLEGLRALFGIASLQALAVIGIAALAASVQSVLYACSRQIYALSRAGYVPPSLSVVHPTNRAPQRALVAGAAIGLGAMLAVWFGFGPGPGSDIIGSVLFSAAILGAMLSYAMQAVSFVLLRNEMPLVERPFRSPLGVAGALIALAIAIVIFSVQIGEPAFQAGAAVAAGYFALALIYFAAFGRTGLVLSPEEEFALTEGRA